MPADAETVTVATLRAWPLPDAGTDKDSRGSVLVVGGSTSTPGAVRLAGESALRVGAGKLQIATVAAAAGSIAALVPECAAVSLLATDAGDIDPQEASRLVEVADGVDCVLIGPGLTDVDAAVDLTGALLDGLSAPVVLDAVGSSYLTHHPEGAKHLGGRALLTVNLAELARVAHRNETEVAKDSLSAASQVARRCGVVVLAGGTEKYVATPEGRSWLVPGGGPGLGVSGSGDVQAGIVAGLVARGADPTQAAVWGSYAHARAGEALSARIAEVGFLARELAEEVPGVLRQLA